MRAAVFPLTFALAAVRDLSPVWPSETSRLRRPFIMKIGDMPEPEEKLEDIAKAKKAAPGEEGSASTVRTRGAVTGHNVRYVLGISLVGIVVAFALVLVFAR
jgi:hypothetical protein